MNIQPGQQFGRFTAVGPCDSLRWTVTCECGTTRSVRRADLLAGRSSSCGCSRRTRRRWSDTQIESMLYRVAKPLGRMPSSHELRVLGHHKLVDAIVRHGGIRLWASKLGMALKDSESTRGIAAQERVAEYLECLGYEVLRMTSGAPFDLMVSGVRVDVKWAKFSSYTGSRGQTCAGFVFATSKRDPTCDMYILCCSDERGEVRYFVPSDAARVVTITITPNGKYSRFRENLKVLDLLVKRHREPF